MITRVPVTLYVNDETSAWLKHKSEEEMMSLSGFVTHKLIDFEKQPQAAVIKKSRTIKNYEKYTVTVPVDVLVPVYDLSKTHNTSASKLISGALMLICEEDSKKNVKSRDEFAGIVLTMALIKFSKMTGDQPRPVDGWEGMLWHILNEMREAKRKHEAQNG